LDLATRKAPVRKKTIVAAAEVPLAPVLLEMGRKVSVNVKKASADIVTYTLSDGSKLKLKPIIVAIDRSLEKYNPQGEPLYQISVGFFVQTDVPKKLKRKVNAK
jgi:hypothetical protein